jgi:uncharacterized protein (DUF433 family)
MGGKPCILGIGVTVGTIVGLVASGYSVLKILKTYPYFEAEDVRDIGSVVSQTPVVFA